MTPSDDADTLRRLLVLRCILLGLRDEAILTGTPERLGDLLGLDADDVRACLHDLIHLG